VTERRVFRKDKYYAETGYEPHDGQVKCHACNIRHRVVPCGRRWGKTLFGGKEVEPSAFVVNHAGEPMQGWIVGPEYMDCEKEFRVIYNTFRSLDLHLTSPKFLNNREAGNMHIRLPWGFDLQCRSAKHPETLTGEGLDFVLMVEAGRQKPRTWREFIRPALSDKRGWSLHTGVPEGDSADSLLFQLFQRGQSTDLNHRFWWSRTAPSWENRIIFPGGYEDPEIQDARLDLTDDEFDRQYGAKFVEKTGRVMKEWDDEIHLADLEYNRNLPLYAAVDYGFTNPFVWLWIQVDRFNNVNVLEEHYITQTDTEQIVRRTLMPHHLVGNLVKFFPDPAEPDDTNIIARLLKKPAAIGTGGELRTRLSLIRRALKTNQKDLTRPQLRVDRMKCPKLAWEMRQGYRWPERRSEAKNDTEKPMDKDNHGPEALGRFFKSHFDIAETRQQHTRIRQGVFV
jgi:hypothetical protein